jgi:hypothetical protein
MKKCDLCISCAKVTKIKCLFSWNRPLVYTGTFVMWCTCEPCDWCLLFCIIYWFHTSMSCICNYHSVTVVECCGWLGHRCASYSQLFAFSHLILTLLTLTWLMYGSFPVGEPNFAPDFSKCFYCFSALSKFCGHRNSFCSLFFLITLLTVLVELKSNVSNLIWKMHEQVQYYMNNSDLILFNSMQVLSARCWVNKLWYAREDIV